MLCAAPRTGNDELLGILRDIRLDLRRGSRSTSTLLSSEVSRNNPPPSPPSKNPPKAPPSPLKPAALPPNCSCPCGEYVPRSVWAGLWNSVMSQSVPHVPLGHDPTSQLVPNPRNSL